MSGSQDDHTADELLTELAGKLDYKTYLRLEQLLSAQRPLNRIA